MADFGLLNQPQNFFASAQNAFLAGQKQAQEKTKLNALASYGTDPEGARNALIANGNVTEAGQLQNQDREQQQFDSQQASQAAAAQQQQQAQVRDWGIKSAAALRALAPEARVQVYQAKIAPALVQMGIPQEQVDAAAQNGITDEELDQFTAALGGPAHTTQMVNTGNGGVSAFDPQRSSLTQLRAPDPKITPPPAGYRDDGNGGLTFIPGGPADTRQAGALAAARRKPGGATGGAGASVAGPAVPGPHAVGGMSADSIENLATRYNTGDSTVLTGLGMGKAGVAMKTAILNRAAELAKGTDATDVMGNRASAKAASGALAALTKNRSNIESFEGTANLNADLTLQAAKDAKLSGQIPVVNAWLRSGRKNFAGDPNVARFELAIGTLADEYAKVVSGGGGNQGATVAAQQEAERRLSRASTPEQLTALVGQMKKEMASRSTSMRAQEASLRAQAAGHPPAEPSKELNGLSPAQHSAAAQFIGHGAQPGSQGNPYTPRSMAEFKGLKPRQWFIDDDGSVHQKGAK